MSTWKKIRVSLSTKLAVTMITGTVLIFGVVFGYNYVQARDTMLRNAPANARNLTRTTVNRISAILSGVEATPQFLARQLEERQPSQAELLSLLRSVVVANSNIYGASVAYAPHAFKPDAEYFMPYYCRQSNPTNPPTLLWLGSSAYRYFDMDWYVIPRELQRPVWAEPYFDEGAGNSVMTTFSAPFFRTVNGVRQCQGVVTADVALERLSAMVSAMSGLTRGYAFLISQNGVFVTHPNKALIMRESLFDLAEATTNTELRTIGRSMLRGEEGFVAWHSLYLDQDAWLYYAPLPGIGWSIGVVFPEEELFGDLLALNHRLLIMGVAGFIGLFLLALWLGHHFTQPVRRIIELASQIASGNLRDPVVALPSFEKSAEGMSTREYYTLAQTFISMTRSLHALLGQVRTSGSQVSETSATIATSACELEATAAEQAAATRQVSATAQGMSNRTQALVRTFGTVASVSAATTGLAGEGQASLQRMEASMQKLTTASRSISVRLNSISTQATNIGGILTSITKVADQTNLLSLNASIEAEKAGEYGLGFAVVAREIRRLSDQTAVSALDIERMIKSMRSAVSTGVLEMDKFMEQVRQSETDVHTVNNRLSTIIEQVQTLTPRFAEVNTDIQAQSDGAGQISEAMQQLSEAARQITESLQEFNRVTHRLNEAAQNMGREVSRFQLDEGAG